MSAVNTEVLLSDELPPETPTKPKAMANPAATYLSQLSKGSRPTMQAALEIIAQLVSGGKCSVATLDWSELRYQETAAIRAMLCNKYAPATTNRMLCALRGTLTEAWKLELMSTRDYMKAVSIKSVKQKRMPKGRVISPGEIVLLMDVCALDQSPAGARDAALIACLIAGVRREEAVNLNLEDFNPDTGELRVNRGKGDKDRTTYLVGGAIAAVNHWIKIRGNQPGPLIYPLNKAHRIESRRMQPQTVRTALKKRIEQCGLQKASPHDLRHTLITQLLDGGADLLTVQKIAGHSSPLTTARYDQRDESAKRRAMSMIYVPYKAALPGDEK